MTPDYRSKFEATVGAFLGSDAVHEPERIKFIQPAKNRYYIPDFKTTAGVYLETKGKWTVEDRMKHLWLKEQNPDKRIVIIFMNARVKIRKGSPTSYGDWATKQGLEWYDWKDGIPQEIIRKIDEDKLSHRDTRRSRRTNSRVVK